MAQPLESLRFDLSDALACHRELLTNLLQGVVALLADAKAHPKHGCFARRQRGKELLRLLREAGVCRLLERRRDRALQGIAKHRAVVLPPRGLEAQWLAHRAQ